MNKNTFKVLEFEKIKEKIREFTHSDLGKKLVDKLEPSSDISVVRRRLDDTSEAKEILNRTGFLPLQGLSDITKVLNKIEKGMILNSEELFKISDFLRGCRKIKKFMNNESIIDFYITSYSHSITEFNDIENEINSSIEGNTVSSKASPKLLKIRKQILVIEDRIEKKLNGILSSNKYKNYIQDFYVSKRNDRFVIPIIASYKNMIEGSIIDKSSTGSTVFIEPNAISKLSSELLSLKIDEDREVYQVLSTLTGFINLYLKEIKINCDVMAEYDFIFAKAKYSNSIDGVKPQINNYDYINIINGTHPLLEGEKVPLNIEIGKEYRSIIITGPNTGGKTIVLKTVGILTLMVQCGIHISASKESSISIFDNILLDIGDNQSIEMSLSTFSSHIKNIIDIIENVDKSTLVLLDEVGTGTDPLEGAGLAAAILEELYLSHAITLATTHYGELKEFAKQHKGFENACMTFDKETLKPLYKLIIGEGGKSNALWISKRLGMKETVLQRAQKYINKDNDIEIKYNIENNSFIEQKEIKEEKNSSLNKKKFEIGDNVRIKYTQDYGIVYKVEDEYGDLIILIKGEYKKINNKRIEIHIKRDKLYPEGYDMSTIFTSWKRIKLEKDIKRGALKQKDYKKILEENNK